MITLAFDHSIAPTGWCLSVLAPRLVEAKGSAELRRPERPRLGHVSEQIAHWLAFLHNSCAEMCRIAKTAQKGSCTLGPKSGMFLPHWDAARPE
jgi:hypothetical protein